MVMAMAMASATHKHKPSSINNILFRNINRPNSESQESIGILAFETARNMSRLVSLYKSLSNEGIKRLKNDVVKSKGVLYLISQDEDYLLNLACSEKSEDLNKAAITVSRLSQRCSDPGLQNFDTLFRDLKAGILDMGKLEYGTKGMEKIVQKMERYVQATANLYTAIEGLNEMEISERKLQSRKKKQEHARLSHANFELFDEKIAHQRKQVKHYKETSLWSKSFDICVRLMAQIVFVIHARLGIVFAPCTIGHPQSSTKKMLQRQQVRPENDFCLISDKDKYMKRRQIHPEKDYCLVSERHKYVRKLNSKSLSRAKHIRQISQSGPIPQTSRKISTARFHSSELSPIHIASDNNLGKKSCIKGVTHLASPSTVGGAGLAYRHANVIITAESCLYSVTSISDEARSELYDMLPENVKLEVNDKLKKKDEMMETIEDGQMQLAEGWREALEEIMEWLAPVAHDTMQWQNERNLERQRFGAKSGVMLMQTLHFADLEKTEAAIVEVLVGLSCMYMYERCGSGGGIESSSDGHQSCEDKGHRPR